MRATVHSVARYPGMSTHLVPGRARRKVLTPENIVVVGWVFLVYQDTVYDHVVPHASLLRLIVPVLLVKIFAFGGVERSGGTFRIFLAIFTAVAVASALSGVSPTLAFIKLALFLAVVLPLTLSTRILHAFYPGSRGLELLFFGGVGLVGLNVVHVVLRSGWLFWNPNMVAMLTVCVLPVALFYFSYASTKRGRIIGAGAVLLCIAVALMSRARAGIYADACMILLYFGFRFSKSINAVAILMGVVGLVGLVATTLIDPVRERVEEVAYKGEEKLVDKVRLLKFEESMDAFQDRPLLGYGFGLSWQVMPSDIDHALKTGRLSGIVGEFGSSTLALLVGGGALLTGAFYAMVVAILLTGLKGVRMCVRGSSNYAFVTAMIAGVAGLVIHAQAEGWILSPLNWISPIFWLYCGLTVSFVAALRRRREAHFVSRWETGDRRRDRQEAIGSKADWRPGTEDGH